LDYLVSKKVPPFCDRLIGIDKTIKGKIGISGRLKNPEKKNLIGNSHHANNGF